MPGNVQGLVQGRSAEGVNGGCVLALPDLLVLPAVLICQDPIARKPAE